MVAGKTMFLGCAMATYWLLFMVLLLGWYKAEFHVLATSASVLTVLLGKSSGIIEKIIN
ncbi:TPA: hypothetical protein HA265_00015 [Candidatus Woesearchaeota archaeon]|nr:hypothetical protein [Candidatus Woesearchaeota archaeon]